MAATDSYTKPQQKQDFSDQKNQDNPTKFHYNFLYKALVVFLFFIILPLFPSQAPEFINQTLLTRSWELLHLLFVGIAISYGLFSRKNDDTEKEDNNNYNASKFDNAQTYVSRFLQVSSVFDEDSESASGADENKVQIWSSQYLRKEPVVVMAQENSVLEEERISSQNKILKRSVEKPLHLPVRSLKETSSVSNSVSRSGSRRLSSNSNKSGNGDFGVLDREELMGAKVKESFVLPSPIPWRSRSGRLELKQDNSEGLAPLPSMEETEFSPVEFRVSGLESSRSSRPNSANSSPKLSAKKSSSSPSSSPSSLSLESQAKIAEDVVKKKSFYNKANPPPAPPPPPPPPPSFYRSSSSMKPSSESNEYSKRSHFDGLSMGKSAGTNGFESVSSVKEEEEEDSVEKMFAESDQEETESEDDDEIGQNFSPNLNGEIVQRNEESGSSSGGDGGPDVDKKADEFIAKFREQIRLQRIESIKRSSAQMSRKLER